MVAGALDPLTSQAHGAGDVQAVRRHLRAGTRAALLLSCASWVILLGAKPLFALCGQPVELAAAAAHYCLVAGAGMLPVAMFQVYRLSLMGTSRFGQLVAAVAAANLVNVAGRCRLTL